jgi:hypothetical protein
MRYSAVVAIILLVVCSGCISQSPVGTEPPDPDIDDGIDDGDSADDGEPDQANGPIENIQSVPLDRRGVGEQYILLDSISKVGSNLSSNLQNDSVVEWHRRTLQENVNGDGPLLITSGIKRYQDMEAARAKMRDHAEEDASDTRISETRISDEITITSIRFTTDSGGHTNTVYYRQEHLIYRVQTLDPKKYHGETAESLLLKMIRFSS